MKYYTERASWWWWGRGGGAAGTKTKSKSRISSRMSVLRIGEYHWCWQRGGCSSAVPEDDIMQWKLEIMTKDMRHEELQKWQEQHTRMVRRCWTGTLTQGGAQELSKLRNIDTRRSAGAQQASSRQQQVAVCDQHVLLNQLFSMRRSLAWTWSASNEQGSRGAGEQENRRTWE